MTPRQRRFVEEYLVDLNATQAAKRAGYNPGWGRELVHKPEVAAAIEKAQAKRAQRTRVSADRVVTELAKVAFGDPRRLFSWGRAATVWSCAAASGRWAIASRGTRREA